MTCEHKIMLVLVSHSAFNSQVREKICLKSTKKQNEKMVHMN